jgi:heme exporter protein D
MIDWLAMGGYGGYVWGSYGVALLAIAIELITLRYRRRHALAQARLEASDGT